MKPIIEDESAITSAREKAANPNTDPDELVVFFMYEPEAVLSNPAFPLILLENPRYVELLHEYNKEFFTAYQLPPILLDWLHNNPSSKVWNSYAQNSFISAKDKEIVAMNSANREVRLSLARNNDLSKESLEILSTDEDASVRSLVASHKGSDKTILNKLAKDCDGWVRRSVAKNVNTPQKCLIELSEDADESVRWSVAENPNISITILEKLASDLDEVVRLTVVRNPLVTQSLLHKLARDPDDFVRKEIAKNPRTLPKTLKILARDNEIKIRFEVLDNPTTPWWLSIALLCDGNPFVRRAARQTIQNQIKYQPWYLYLEAFGFPILITILTGIVISIILFLTY